MKKLLSLVLALAMVLGIRWCFHREQTLLLSLEKYAGFTNHWLTGRTHRTGKRHDER